MKRLFLLLCMCCSLAAAFPAAAERERAPREGDYSSREANHDNHDNREQRRDQYRQRREQISPEQRDQIRRDVYDYGRDSHRGERGGGRRR